MKIQVPSYYKDFKCIADRCVDNCCIGWEIDVDDATLNKYDSLEGKEGDAIRSTLNRGNPTTFKLLENERCANLDCRGLCKIISCLGEGYLCQICRDHPRYFNETAEGIEGGIGLACEEAARLIITADNPSTTVSVDYPEVTPRYVCEEELSLKVRGYVFKYVSEMNMCGEDVEVAINRLMEISNALDNTVLANSFLKRKSDITFADLQNPNLDKKCSLDVISEMCHAFCDAEALTADFPEKLNSAINAASEDGFYVFVNGDGKRYFSNLLFYFIHRYFLSDEAAYLQNMGFAIASSLLISAMVYKKEDHSLESFIAEAKDFSKNVEYSEENVDGAIENMGKVLHFY